MIYITITLILISGSAFAFIGSPIRRLQHSLARNTHFGQAEHDTEQFKLFKNNCEGNWKGLQAGYDPQDDEVEDYMYTEVNIEPSGNGEELKQMNGFVVGEIRADCEVCFDSERLKTKEAGLFSDGSLGNRKCCANVDVRGPSPTVRGLSMEVGFRHGDGKMRILLSYSPIDFDDNQVPLAMGLMDVVITRERLGKRPLKLDEKEGGWDVYWRETKERDFDKLAMAGEVVSNEVVQFLPSDISVVWPSAPLTLASLDAAKKDTQEHHHHHIDGGGHVPGRSSGNTDEKDDDDNFVYRRVFRGGLLVECQAIVYPGAPTAVKLAHAPSPNEPVVYTADLSFAALEPPSVEAIEATGEVRLLPPRLLDLRVGKMETVGKF